MPKTWDMNHVSAAINNRTRKLAQKTLNEKISHAAESQEPEILNLEKLVNAYRS